MMKLGFDGALMSGSGSCVFGITRNQEIMNKGYEFFRKRYFFVRKSKILTRKKICDKIFFFEKDVGICNKLSYSSLIMSYILLE